MFIWMPLGIFRERIGEYNTFCPGLILAALALTRTIHVTFFIKSCVKLSLGHGGECVVPPHVLWGLLFTI